MAKANKYDVDSNMKPGVVRFGYGQDWLADVRDHDAVVQISYASGYTTTTVLSEIKQSPPQKKRD